VEAEEQRTISPELVLVDPELAARARAALPEDPWPAPVRIEPRPAPVPASRVPAAVSLWLFGLALVAVVFALSLVSTRDRPTFAAESGPSGPQPAPATAPQPPPPPATAPEPPPPPAPQAARPSAPQSAPPRRTRQRTQTRPAQRTRRAPPRTTSRPPAAAPSRPKRPAGFRPARVFSWPPQAGASFYQVIFLRNGEPFYRAETLAARIRLPGAVRFTPGRYRWTVRPAIASDARVRLAPAIIDSTFQVGGG
jgi:hypothetical protein